MTADEHYFTCPVCGSHYFGTPCKIVDGKSELDFSKVRCHGESSGGPFWCGKIFPRPGYKQEEQGT